MCVFLAGVIKRSCRNEYHHQILHAGAKIKPMGKPTKVAHPITDNPKSTSAMFMSPMWQAAPSDETMSQPNSSARTAANTINKKGVVSNNADAHKLTMAF